MNTDLSFTEVLTIFSDFLDSFSEEVLFTKHFGPLLLTNWSTTQTQPVFEVEVLQDPNALADRLLRDELSEIYSAEQFDPYIEHPANCSSSVEKAVKNRIQTRLDKLPSCFSLVVDQFFQSSSD